MANIVIIVGTESGNALMVADVIKDELETLGHQIKVEEEPDYAAIDPANCEVMLVCTSSHGEGEMPDNIIPFHDALQQQRPDLSHLRYGVIALGDQTFSTFCKAGKDMDTLLACLGANKVGKRLEIDACTQPLPDEDALEWVLAWVKMLNV